MLHAFLNRAWPENDAGAAASCSRSGASAHDLLGYDGWPVLRRRGQDDRLRRPAIPEFIDRITELAPGPAERDFAMLLDRLREDHPDAARVDRVDKIFYAEVLRRERFDVDAQQVRRYFDFAKVRAGPARRDRPALRPGVRRGGRRAALARRRHVVRRARPRRATRLGRIYLDLHPRPGKY